MTQLIQHERIETTHPRAKELAKFADRCVTLAKDVRPCKPKNQTHTNPAAHSARIAS